MFIVNILSFVICKIFACVILSIIFRVFVFTVWIINVIKKHIVWLFLDKVFRLTLYPSQKRYSTDFVETGFSMSSRYRSAPIYHYKYVTVFDGTYRNVVVWFANNIKIKINIKEESLLYQKLINI